MLSKLFAPARLLLVAGACILSHGCAEKPRPRQAATEAPPPPPETNPTPDAARAASLPGLQSAEPAEVDGAVERVFKGAVAVETEREPYFVVGDFNGDDSQDVAVVVRPAPGKLTEVNDELANWILVAPFAKSAPKDLIFSELHGAAAGRRVLAGEGDVLLAVIHGFGPDGWRDSRATQTYVLKDAAGGEMKARDYKQAVRADDAGKLPRLVGDLIAQTVGGQSGFLYYDGAKYAWYDPRSFKPSPPARVVHGGPVKSVRQ